MLKVPIYHCVSLEETSEKFTLATQPSPAKGLKPPRRKEKKNGAVASRWMHGSVARLRNDCLLLRLAARSQPALVAAARQLGDLGIVTEHEAGGAAGAAHA